MSTTPTDNQGLPLLDAPWTLGELQPYLVQLVLALEGHLVQKFQDVADFNARVPQPTDFMLVGLTDPGTLNVYLNGQLNQVWPALPAYQYGTEPPTHTAPFGTIYVQTD